MLFQIMFHVDEHNPSFQIIFSSFYYTIDHRWTLRVISTETTQHYCDQEPWNEINIE